MSSRHWKFRIDDIVNSIDKINAYLELLTLAEFEKSELIIDAVVRNFEIIGEASRNIPETIRIAYPSVPWNQMNAMRNILIHEYFGVDAKLLWHTAKQYLPDLRTQLTLLKDEQK